MENFKSKRNKPLQFVLIFTLIVNTLQASEQIETFVSNYTRSIGTMSDAVQIRMTNYLLIANTVESLSGNEDIYTSLDNLMQNSNSEKVRHHAAIVKTAIENSCPDDNDQYNCEISINMNRHSQRTILIFLDYINHNLFK